MSGSDLTNKLVAAGLAWLPASLLGEAAGTVVLPSGGDDTAAIQAAATSLGVIGGGMLQLGHGNFTVSTPIELSSNTYVKGSGLGTVINSSTHWVTPSGRTDNPNMIFENVNHAGPAYTDQNITVSDLTFNLFNTNHLAGSHAVRFRNAQTLVVSNCLCLYGNDGVDYVTCYDTLTYGCSAYFQTNAAYNAWGGAKYARVIGCYAESATAVQMVTFNANIGNPAAPAETSDGFIIANCHLRYTGAGRGYAEINLSTLATQDTCKNIIITNNILDACPVIGVGNLQNITVSGNTMINLTTNQSAIAFFGDGTTPTNVNVSGNTIINPQTTFANLGVIRLNVNGYSVTGNTVSGSSFYAACSVGSTAGLVAANNFSTLGSFVETGTAFTSTVDNFQFPNGGSLQWYDTAGVKSFMQMQSDNNFIFWGTQSDGSVKVLFEYQNHSSNQAFRVGPTTELAVSDPGNGYIQIQSSDTTGAAGPLIAVAGAATNQRLDLAGKGNLGVSIRSFRSAIAPTTANVLANQAVVWDNSGDGSVKIYYNQAGTLKSVTLS